MRAEGPSAAESSRAWQGRVSARRRHWFLTAVGRPQQTLLSGGREGSVRDMTWGRTVCLHPVR